MEQLCTIQISSMIGIQMPTVFHSYFYNFSLFENNLLQTIFICIPSPTPYTHPSTTVFHCNILNFQYNPNNASIFCSTFAARILMQKFSPCSFGAEILLILLFYHSSAEQNSWDLFETGLVLKSFFRDINLLH